MYILGISAFYHDSAAAIIKNGDIIAAAQEERFTRKKHDPRFPSNAINYCLAEAFIEPDELEVVAFYDNPVLTLDRIVRNFLTTAPDGEEGFVNAMNSQLVGKQRLTTLLKSNLGTSRPLWHVDHHISHAASAFYPSPYEASAILTVDGVGEHATLTIGHGSGNKIELLAELKYPHSLGLLYSAVTNFCGFKVNSGEYKLMGLAPYGEPRYAGVIEDKLIDIREDGSFALDMDYFAFPLGEKMVNEKFHQLFDGPPRKPESRITKREMDIAASIQQVTEKVMLHLAHHAKRLTGDSNLVMAGGVALNCVASGKIHCSNIFDNIWVQPAAGDAGGALGAALYVHHHGLDRPRSPGARDSQKGSYLGPSYSKGQIATYLDSIDAPYEQFNNEDEWATLIAAAIADGKIVGFMQGRMEFGPRSLGARSIIGDPRNLNMQSRMNLKIKYRESFRPFAPAVLYDHAAEYFDFDAESSYMLMVAPVHESKRKHFDLASFRAKNDDMLQMINQPRSSIPAVTHVDYSARLQTVHPEESPTFYRVISAFYRETGCPLVINTSFNVRGEPIVNTPEDAYRCFMRTGIDLLVIDDFLLWKNQQPESFENDDWKEEFELD